MTCLLPKSRTIIPEADVASPHLQAEKRRGNLGGHRLCLRSPRLLRYAAL